MIRATNADKPFDRFVVEQLAGDELSGYVPGQDATPEVISLLEATHYLRNGPDGSGESDGNADEVRIDRYSVLEATEQIVASSLLGVTIQCAKCHDHKFEPISQRDYYQLQAVFFPVYNHNDWVKPNDRVVYVNPPGVMSDWEQRGREIDSRIAELKADFAAWVRENRPPSRVLFDDAFEETGPPLADRWSATAPGDDAPGGTPSVQLDTTEAPAAVKQQGRLAILESGAGGKRWLSTREAFDWTPDKKGRWIQVTFDLIDNKAGSRGTAAERIPYFIAAHDFDDNGPQGGGNVLIDGNPAGGAVLYLDYPGDDAKPLGNLGTSRYEPGHNYGVRVTHVDTDKFLVEPLYDYVPEEKNLTLSAADLPNGGFAFEYSLGRSFIVDNVVVEASDPSSEGEAAFKAATERLEAKRKELADTIKEQERSRGDKPGKLAWVTDRSPTPPEVRLLERGNYATPGEKVEPAPLSALARARRAARR